MADLYLATCLSCAGVFLSDVTGPAVLMQVNRTLRKWNLDAGLDERAMNRVV